MPTKRVKRAPKLITGGYLRFPGMTMVLLPVRLKSEKNQRGSWHGKAWRTKHQRMVTRAWLRRACVAMVDTMEIPKTVHLVRMGPGLLDTDNIQRACSAPRDEVAAFFGVTDGPTGPIEWTYDQEKSAAYGCRIELIR